MDENHDQLSISVKNALKIPITQEKSTPKVVAGAMEFLQVPRRTEHNTAETPRTRGIEPFSVLEFFFSFHVVLHLIFDY